MADLGIRYATALFDISQENGLLDDYLEQARLIRDNIVDEDAQSILTHPRISSEEKFAFLQKAFEKNIHCDLMGFIRLVVTKNREAFLLPAVDRLIDMIKEYKRQTTAKVVSAVPLTDEQAAKLTTVLSKKLNKQVDITVLVDPSVIAGISIQADGYFFDRTVRTMLKDMKESIEL
ncbi:MAG: ATP synthase F1 subunit delta [Defluviitaleaceae bacterium]|nr:ATP synthase F1 subunit delta [Defluviitaleaceae bacterium]